MPFFEAKKNFNKEEIIDILKKNVALYKSEPEFINYIVELAMYLIECQYEKRIEQPSIEEQKDGMPNLKDVENKDNKLSEQSAKRIYKAFRSYAPNVQDMHCHLCGAPTYGKRKCPNCGNMA